MDALEQLRSAAALVRSKAVGAVEHVDDEGNSVRALGPDLAPNQIHPVRDARRQRLVVAHVASKSTNDDDGQALAFSLDDAPDAIEARMKRRDVADVAQKVTTQGGHAGLVREFLEKRVVNGFSGSHSGDRLA